MAKIKDYTFAGIYQFLNLQNGKRYIGQAQNVATRYFEHRRKRNLYKTRIAFYNAVNKYGWDAFEFSVIEKVADLEKLNEREQFWMDTFQSFKKENGYNICREANTTRGYKYSEKTRKRLSEWAKFRVGEKNTFYGKKHSEETKRKIGEANSKWERTEEIKKAMREARAIDGSGKPKRKVIQVQVEDNKEIRVWDSISDAARGVEISVSAICHALSGKLKTAKGFKWRYLD